MPRVHARIDERDAHAGSLGALMSGRDAEGGEVGLQVVQRIVVRAAGLPGVRERMELL